MFTERVGCRATPSPCPRSCSGAVRQSESGAQPQAALAIAYVPMQRWQNIEQPEQGWHAGTIFADLDLPWCVPPFARGKCKGNGGCRV